MTFATGYIGQFVWLYLFNEVGMSNLRANIMLVSIPILLSACTYPAWGRIVDRFGSKPALLISGLLVINGATAWIFVTRDHWVFGYVCAMIATMAWPGMDLAGFNLLLRMTDTGGKSRASSSIIAINSFVVSIAGTLSGLFGGAVAGLLGKHWHTAIFGWPLSYHGVLFIVSGVLRAAALLWLLSMKETKGVATRDALNYMITSVYSNLQQATFYPVRMLATVAKVTWRLPKISSRHGRKP
jgi:MFS family permease